MRFEQLVGPVSEVRAIHTTAGGLGVTTTPQFLHVPAGAEAVQVVARNFSTAVAVQLALCPWLVILKTADLLVTATDYSENAQDGSAATDVTLSSLDTFANGDAVYVGSHLPFRGLVADVDAANATASVLSADYWDGNSWESLSITDGTASGGATFAVDGNITFTVPTDWAPTTLKDAVATCTDAVPNGGVPLYWLRLKASAALDSSTTLNSLLAMARSTSYMELTEINPEFSVRVERGGPGGIGAIEVRTDAGTASVVANALVAGRFA